MNFNNWTPTPDNVNALPQPLRDYIHDLQTNCDPAGNLLTIEALRQQRDALLLHYANCPGLVVAGSESEVIEK